MVELIVIMLGSLLRMLLLGLFGALIERGVWTTGQVEQIAIGLAGFIATAVWALWKHYKNRLKFLTALESPAGTSEAMVKAKIANGNGASIATLLVLALVASIASMGCAGTLRDRVRTSALMAGETVLTLDQMERDLYATGAYGADAGVAKAKHLEIGSKVDGAILAVRAYERGARAWPAELPTMPANLPELQRLALDALAQLAHVLDGVRGTAGMQAEITKLIKQIGG